MAGRANAAECDLGQAVKLLHDLDTIGRIGIAQIRRISEVFHAVLGPDHPGNDPSEQLSEGGAGRRLGGLGIAGDVRRVPRGPRRIDSIDV